MQNLTKTTEHGALMLNIKTQSAVLYHIFILGEAVKRCGEVSN
jgi:uncharacterized protein with HEPN domain